MINPRVATRYAKGLMELAAERQAKEAVFADMNLLLSLCQGSREFVVVLRSPVIKADKKEKILDALTLDRMNPITTAFCHLLVRKSREGYLPEIAAAFIDQYKQAQGIQMATLTTATPASPELIARLVDKIKKKKGVREVELRTVVREDLIGGFVLEVGDELVDASIAYDLKNIRKQFQNNEFIYQIR